jgi:predicted ester cyclase
MSITENKELVLKYLEAINKRPKPLEILQEYLADQPLIEHILFAEQAFPLYWLEVDEMIAEGDLISLRTRLRGVHQGDFMGVPPTGKEIDVPCFLTYRIAGGKIVDHWMMVDNALLMQQLGVEQPQAQTAE